MGFREFFRGTTAADDEARAPAPENELPLLGGVHRVERHMTGGGSTPPPEFEQRPPCGSL
jgi:hypothetical protein